MRIGARAEALIYAAARAQLVEERVRPLLEGGDWVLLDRFVDSSLAYQGAARGLGIEEVAAINAFGTGGLTADRTLLLRIDPAAGRARQEGRDDRPDRLEREDATFFAAIADAYDALAAEHPERFAVIDAAAPPDDVLAAALDATADLLGAVVDSGTSG
jgi:dTMP kinase